MFDCALNVYPADRSSLIGVFSRSVKACTWILNLPPVSIFFFRFFFEESEKGEIKKITVLCTQTGIKISSEGPIDNQ